MTTTFERTEENNETPILNGGVSSFSHQTSHQTGDQAAQLAEAQSRLMQVIARFEGVGGKQKIEALGVARGCVIHVAVPSDMLVNFYTRLRRRLPLTLVTMVALDEREQTGAFALRYVFAIERTAVNLELHVALDSGGPASVTFPSLTGIVPAANWYEREARDLFAIEPVGHPDPRPLALHDQWPDGLAPLRHDYDGSAPPPRTEDTRLSPTPIQGEGVMEIAVGPIHAGVIEPGHFRFTAVGEQIIHLDTRFFYTHRGVEKRAEGLPVERAVSLVERNCAACTVSSTLAYCQALEILAETEVPERALLLRVIYAELERLYNHVGDIGNICAGIGFHAGSQLGATFKEGLLALNEQLVGSRYLFGVLRLGGVRRAFTVEDTAILRKALADLNPACERLLHLIWSNVGVVDRLTGTGVLPLEVAHDLGAVGVAARASGIARDVRLDHPYAAYSMLKPPRLCIQQQGDVAARLRVRADEISASLALLDEALMRLPHEGALARPLGTLPANESAFSVTESPRGANCHWILAGPNNTLARYRIRSASFANWPVVPRAVQGNIVPDFPLINKSFELCYSCLDR